MEKLIGAFLQLFTTNAAKVSHFKVRIMLLPTVRLCTQFNIQLSSIPCELY
jgi:hypothetical protein